MGRDFTVSFCTLPHKDFDILRCFSFSWMMESSDSGSDSCLLRIEEKGQNELARVANNGMTYKVSSNRYTLQI